MGNIAGVMTGKKIGHFRVQEEIGSGGMGRVYKAVDERLERFVALKFLNRDLDHIDSEKERFIKEAKTASSLDHANICTIYEIGETEAGQIYIAMAYYHGRTLREMIDEGPLPIETAVEIVIQIAAGIEAAHNHDIIHRDLKPSNIMVTQEGVVKILDFGLAKLRGQQELTKKGVLLGTLDYMSPELFQSDAVSKKSDIWSLGVMMYEMLVGKKPFTGKSEQAIMYAILNALPPAISKSRPEVPTWLDQVVEKTLAKDDLDRFESMGTLKNQLSGSRKKGGAGLGKHKKWLAITGAILVLLLVSWLVIMDRAGSDGSPGKAQVKGELSIAVLPFKDISANGNQAFFCDGMAEELINALSKIDGLKVTSSTSSAYFKDKVLEIGEIGRRLKVKNVIEGSVGKDQQQIRIFIRLVQVKTGYQLWAHKYQTKIENIFPLQEEIASKIADTLKIKLVKEKSTELFKRYTSNLEAYNAYMKGRHFWNRRFPEDLAKGLEYFRKAIRIDPEYALAYVGLADTYHLMTSYTMIPPRRAFPLARTSAQKALEIDPGLGEAHNSLAAVKLLFDWDWKGAEREFKRALELNPNHVTAHEWYAIYLAIHNRLPEALRQMRMAVKLDPFSTSSLTGVARHLYFARQYDQAVRQFEKVLEIDPNCFWAMAHLGQTLIQMDRFARAEAVFKKAILLTREKEPGMLAGLAFTYANGGQAAGARKILTMLIDRSKQSYVPAFYIACIYMALNEKPQTFRWLEKAFQERSEWMIYLGIEPCLDPISSEPQFIGLLSKVGLTRIGRMVHER